MPYSITNELMGIADGLLSHFSEARGTGHRPDNPTLRFLHHQWRQRHFRPRHMPNGNFSLQVSF